MKVDNFVSNRLQNYISKFLLQLGPPKRSILATPMNHNKIFDAVVELLDFPTENKKKITYEKPFHGYASSALHERLVIEEEGFEICGHLY